MSRDKIVEELRKNFGSLLPKEGQTNGPPDYLSTGIASADWVMGGGLPKGHITMIYGPDGAGKSGFSVDPMLWAIEHPEYNGVTLYIDTEGKANTNLFSKLGVPEDKLIIVRTYEKDNPLTGEKALEITKAAMGEVDLIVIDSIVGLTPSVGFNMEAGDTAWAINARLLSFQLPIIKSMLGGTKTAMILINQQRANMASYGADFKQYGGWSAKHTPSVTVRMRKSGLFDGGFNVTMRCYKNSLAPENREAEWPVMYDSGVDKVADLFYLGKKMGVINARGYCNIGELVLNHNGERGQKDAISRMKEEPGLYDKVYKLVMEAKSGHHS